MGKSLSLEPYGSAVEKALLAPWPVPRRPNWGDHVNSPQTEAELAALRRSVERGSPFGDSSWTEKAVLRLGLGHTPPTRPAEKDPEGIKGS